MKLEYEEIMSGDRTLRGIKHTSFVNSKNAFLVVHGYFSSNKIGPHRLYVKIANEICEKYGDCYRFDLSGMGESDGDISSVTLETHVEDLYNILQHIKKTSKKDIIVISHCIGCNLVLNILESQKFFFREVIFLAPYFTNEKILELFFKDKQQIYDLYVKGHTNRNGLYTDRSFFLDKTFYNNFFKSIKESKFHINIIAASCDQFIPFDCNEMLRTDTDDHDVSFCYIPKADHNFLITQQELIEKICSLIEDNKFTKDKFNKSE